MQCDGDSKHQTAGETKPCTGVAVASDLEMDTQLPPPGDGGRYPINVLRSQSMPDDRCFRIDELDLDELRDQTRDQKLIASFSNWIQNFAPHVDSVVSQITAAFDGTRLGDGIGLLEANGLDDYASGEELKRLRATDEKLDWKRISYSDLARCYSSPSFFDAQGFVFHLPAFLIAELNDKHPYGFIDRLFRLEEHPKGWRALLTPEQRNAIISTLELIREHPNYEHDLDDIDTSIQWLRDVQKIG